MIKKHRKIYYTGGSLSLILLPILIFLTSQQQIENLLRKRTIEFDLPPADGSFVDHLQLSPSFAGKHTKFTYSFYDGNEKAQIDSFRSFHTMIEKKYDQQSYYFVITVDDKCSYNLFVQVLDILDQIKYEYEHKRDALYARRLSSKAWARRAKNGEVRHDNTLENLRKKYLLLSPDQQSVITIIGIAWLFLLLITIKRSRNILSAG